MLSFLSLGYVAKSCGADDLISKEQKFLAEDAWIIAMSLKRDTLTIPNEMCKIEIDCTESAFQHFHGNRLVQDNPIERVTQIVMKKYPNFHENVVKKYVTGKVYNF